MVIWVLLLGTSEMPHAIETEKLEDAGVSRGGGVQVILYGHCL